MTEDAVEKAPFTEQLRSLGIVYWIANWMELVERFAYYGLRTVLPGAAHRLITPRSAWPA